MRRNKKETKVWKKYNTRYWINPPFWKWVQLYVREKYFMLYYHWKNYRLDRSKGYDKIWSEHIR